VRVKLNSVLTAHMYWNTFQESQSDPEFSRNVCDLHDYIRIQELDDVFPETYKLRKLILTIPATSSSTETSFSALKRIKNYLRNTRGQERMSSLSLSNDRLHPMNK
jgi:hypothetical protein